MKTSSDPKWDIPLEEVKWRPVGRPSQRGEIRYAAYPDARTVQKHLDDVFGWDGWQTELIPIEGGVVCQLSVWSPERKDWIVKSDGSENTAMSATKGGISGALRRAAAQLGIGRNIYDLPEVWGPYNESNGKYYAPRGVEKELIARVKKLMDEGAPSADEEDEPGLWDEFLARFEKLSEGGQALIREWWSTQFPEAGPPTEKIVGTEAFQMLMMRLDTEETDPF